MIEALVGTIQTIFQILFPNLMNVAAGDSNFI